MHVSSRGPGLHRVVVSVSAGKLTTTDHDVWCPRFSPDGKHLVYFQCLAGGPHHSCAALIMVSHTHMSGRTLSSVPCCRGSGPLGQSALW